jgi:glycosyltransferase involved in cell wall biosynthesis
MKILHIIPNLKKGGAERLALNIVSELQSTSNIEVQLITFRSENDYPFLSNSINWKVIPSSVIPSLLGKAIIEVQDLQAYIDAFQPDVIHSHLFETEMVLAHISLPQKTKRIVHFHDNIKQFRNFRFSSLFNKSSLTEFYEKRIVLKGYAKNTSAICISKDTKQFADKVFPRNITTTLLHNAIDLARFQCIDTQIKNNEITIIGSLVDKKGQQLAIDCIEELKSRGVLVRLNILGEGPNRSILQYQIEQLHLQDFVTLHGNVEFPEQFLQRSRLYLHTAIYEPFGLVLIEAMACGLPVVCTDGKGNRDLIKESENGFMVWERNPKLLADKIEMLLKNESLYIEMSKNASVFASKFGIEKYVKSLLKLYNN